MAYTQQQWVDGDPSRPLSAARMKVIEDGVTAAAGRADDAYTLAQGGGGSNPLHVVPLSSFAGSDDSQRFRDSLAKLTGTARKPAVAITPGATLDAGTSPFLIPAGYSMVGAEGVETEFGYSCPVNLRHTGATSDATKGVFKTSPRGTNENGTKGWSMRGLAFFGTASTKAFCDNPADASGSVWSYVVIDNVSWNQFQSIYYGPMLGTQITGTTYMNNIAQTAFYCGGSDNNLWTDGGFMEMGLAQPNYATRAALPAMIRFGTMTKTRIGALYITGSPTTPFRLDGGDGGIAMDNLTLEGRPVPGVNQLWCAGELVRLGGGSLTARNKWWGFAMRDPAATGRNPGGFIHITGGDHVIDGGTFEPFTAATYPGYTTPSGASYPAGVVPPFIYITGGHVRVSNISLGPKAAGVKPIIKYVSAAMVDSDTSCTLSQI